MKTPIIRCALACVLASPMLPLAASAQAGAASPAVPSTAEAPRTRAEAAAAWSEDGLERREVRGLDLLYVRPGADLSVYRRLWLRPVEVSFQRDWARAQERATGTRIRPRDIQQIRDDMAAAVQSQVARELQRDGYALADGPGEDVLELRVRVTELYLNAADLPSANIVRNYTMSFGHMTLVADLRDSVTGDAVMRVLDRTLGRDYGFLRFTTRVENAREVGAAAQSWAAAVARQLALAGARPGGR
jgi:hypothetical protein